MFDCVLTELLEQIVLRFAQILDFKLQNDFIGTTTVNF